MPAETPHFNLEIQKAVQPFINPYVAEELEDVFNEAIPGLLMPGRLPPDPPTFWDMMISFFHENNGCTVNAMAMANAKNHWMTLQQHRAIPSGIRGSADPEGAIGLWLTLEMYLCVWNVLKIWPSVDGISMKPSSSHLEEILCCKYKIMEKYGIEECASIHGHGVPLSAGDAERASGSVFKKKCCLTYKGLPGHLDAPVDSALSKVTPRASDRLEDCCHENGCEIVLDYGWPCMHVVAGTLTCEDGRFIVQIREHPLQGGDGVTVELHPPGTNPSDPTNMGDAQAEGRVPQLTSTVLSRPSRPTFVSPEEVERLNEANHYCYGQSSGRGAAIQSIVCFCV